MNFAELGLHPQLLNALKKQAYEVPTPIQEQAIPAILAGKDVMAAAQTGTGKTAGFSLPLLQNLQLSAVRARPNHARALILTPTRELAAQVAQSVETYGAEFDLKYNLVFGGVKINPQMMKLRKGTDVLIATPGRLLDLYQQNAIRFSQIEVLVLDEADRMLDMGFIKDIKKILALLPSKRQNLLFSATFSDDIRTLARSLMNDAVEISVTPPNTTVERINQLVHPVDKGNKAKALIHLIKTLNWYQVLVFCRTKHGANKLTLQLNKAGISAAAIHGNKSQNVRTRALADFKADKIQILVATDIAARGIDIAQLPFVVNFDLPHVAEDYVHRIGRTGRAGKSGLAVSLVCADEAKQLAGIERLINLKIEQQLISAFSPTQTIGPVKLKSKPKKPKKPKTSQAKQSHQSPATNKGQPGPKPRRFRSESTKRNGHE